MQAKITIVVYVEKSHGAYKCLFGENKSTLGNRWKSRRRARKHASRSGEVILGNIFCWWGGFTLPRVKYFLVGKHRLFGAWASLGEKGCNKKTRAHPQTF